MRKELWSLDRVQLEALYKKAANELEQRLLDGASWEEVSDQRKRVGEVLTILYKKSNPEHFGNPAEKPSRNNNFSR